MLEGLVSFFEAQETVVAGYTLDGLPLEKYTHTCFQAPVWCLFSVRSQKHPLPWHHCGLNCSPALCQVCF